MKNKNISKFLSERFGGKWNYDGFSGWWCDDKKRFMFKKHLTFQNTHVVNYNLYGQDDSPIDISTIIFTWKGTRIDQFSSKYN